MSDEGDIEESLHERTMMVQVPGFDQRNRPYKPYAFPRLEKVTRTQSLLVRRLAWVLPGVGSDGGVEADLLERLKSLLDTSIELKVDYVHVVEPKSLKRYVAEPTFLAVLAPLPHLTRGLIEVELALAHRAIDQLLGGPGEMSTLRPLTEIEEAVMSFMVLETLKVLAPHLDPGLPRLRLERLARRVEEALDLLAKEPHVVVVQLKMTLGGQDGFIRLMLPESVLRMASAPAASVERTQRQLQNIRPHLSRLEGFKAWMRVEIGHTEVSSNDLASMEPRSVVLIDELTAFPHRGEGGTAQLRFGLGQAGTLSADVYMELGRFHARVTGIAIGNRPNLPRAPTADEEEAAEMLAEGADAPQALVSAGSVARANYEAETTSPHGLVAGPQEKERALEETNEGVELLSDIPLQIVVELARVPVTAEEIVSLRVGQVFDLNRLPNEPVELSVNGKVVARGELVEVEGHLGVRILSLLG
jgi:flagellar motor switch protein FliM